MRTTTRPVVPTLLVPLAAAGLAERAPAQELPAPALADFFVSAGR